LCTDVAGPHCNLLPCTRRVIHVPLLRCGSIVGDGYRIIRSGQQVHQTSSQIVDQVGIGVDRSLKRGVPHLAPDVHEYAAARWGSMQKQARERMPQLVRPAAFKPGSAKRRTKIPLGDVCVVVDATRFVSKNVPRHFVELVPQALGSELRLVTAEPVPA
jgi:hypothetical protein